MLYASRAAIELHKVANSAWLKKKRFYFVVSFFIINIAMNKERFDFEAFVNKVLGACLLILVPSASILVLIALLSVIF